MNQPSKSRLIQVEYTASSGLASELAAIGKASTPRVLPTTAEEFVAEFLASAHGLEVRHQAASFRPGSRILDIGVGGGASSVYLCRLGHAVTVVEPSPDLCAGLHQAALAYGLPLEIYVTNAESINQVEGRFDYVIFSSSFHHCDDPLGALRCVGTKLQPGGRVLLLNEPILQCYRSKSWFFRKLAEFPEEMGHYGGNEHIYRYGEYVEMLRAAGFRILSCPPHQTAWSVSARMALWASRPAARFHRRQRLIKWCYYATVALLIRVPPAMWLLRSLSLLSISFIAERKDDARSTKKKANG